MNTTVVIVALCISLGSVVSLPDIWNMRQTGNPSVKDGDTCTNCIEVVTSFIASLGTDEVQGQVETYFDGVLCSPLSAYYVYLQEICTSEVRAVIPQVLDYIAANADPSGLCTLATLCPENEGKPSAAMVTKFLQKTLLQRRM